jgi:phospholipid transport system substrate-binding protein
VLGREIKGEIMKVIFKFSVLILFLGFSSLAMSGPKKDTTLMRSPTSTPSSSEKVGDVVSRPTQASAGTPTRAIQDLESKSDDYKTGPHLTAADQAHNAQIKREIITGTFDVRELSRLSLDKHWTERTSTEQDSFVNLMTQLLEKKAVLSKEQSKVQGKKYFVKYLGDTYLDTQKTRAKTRTLIRVPKEDVSVSIEYRLVKTATGWKIFDVIVDDASLVDNYRYQFDSIITKHGYSELVNRMSKKLSEMESKS